ncbi:MAG: GMC family oxidoreductase [Thermoanaerobaculia bacterium]|nr:GMC family oxidoreductase [Thermoanaerobaculia bacterium]
MQVVRSPEVRDVVVIGSGAGGGTAVQVLTELGVNVTLLEAGGMIDPTTDFKEHLLPHEVPHRGAYDDAATYFGRAPMGFFSAPNGYWQIAGEPYTVARGSEFEWFRSRVLGGRTNHWGRISLRFSDYDFEPYSTDGLGTDWPISYADVAPYYEKVERFVGITGSREGLRSAPDGVFQPPPPPRVHEVLIQRACEQMGIPCIPNRRAVITRRTNGRPPCHYCGQCGRGCITASNYSSSNVQILPAMQTGRLEVVTGAMARELVTDDEGRVTAVSYVDKATRSEQQIRCRTVVLAASACESARLLLNSKSSRFPAGLANGSGVVGRFLMDTVGFELWGQIPALEGMPRYNSDGAGGAHLYMPWWQHERPNRDFPRGYHIEIGGGFGMPMLGSFAGAASRHGGYGAALKEALRQGYGTRINLAGRGEMIPNLSSYCEIDDDTVDDWGIPVLRFHWRWTDYEWKQARHMERTFREIIERMGGSVGGISNPRRDGKGISIGGSIIHELGCIRMGHDPRSSALNDFCQAWEVPNLFVADAAPFVSCPDKNPTLTIMALAWRTSEYLAELLRRGDV